MTSPSIRNFSQLRGPPASCFSGGYPPRPPRPRGLQLPLPATTIGPFIMDFRNFRQKGKIHASRLQMLCYSLPPTQRCRAVSPQGWRAWVVSQNPIVRFSCSTSPDQKRVAVSTSSSSVALGRLVLISPCRPRHTLVVVSYRRATRRPLFRCNRPTEQTPSYLAPWANPELCDGLRSLLTDDLQVRS